MSDAARTTGGQPKVDVRGGVTAGAIVVGGIAIGAAVAGLIAIGGPSNSTPIAVGASQLELLAPQEIDAGASTLRPDKREALVADAKSCRAPLGVMTIAGQGGYVRIKSGDYVSPYFPITGVSQRVAFPLPAPYSRGAGTIFVEGDTAPARYALTPIFAPGGLVGQGAINIVWSTNNPCQG